MRQVLLIGGTDSSGGAGLTRDVAVTTELGCVAKPVVTCVTAQTNTAVEMIHEIPVSVITAQINAAFAETTPDAIKIGMIGTRITANAIADALADRNVPVVLDPVLKSTSGTKLGEKRALNPLIAMATLLTPNLDEAAGLSNRRLADCETELSAQAAALRTQGVNAVLIKGGHGQGDTCCDHLFDGAGHFRFCAPRLAKSRRGTGCTLATAVACELARGCNLRQACSRAKRHMQIWISDQFGNTQN